ncbi:zinc-binding dehydrogenase [Caballeronia udeis]|uniref:zinc-binding dehydrogenase n=1 Tax=Caballeronia udeis TaxID=1232866 RepID=UPI0012E8D23E
MANRLNGYVVGNDRCQPFGRDEKLERAKTLGAYAGVNYRRHEDWAGEVLKLTDGAGVDHVLEVGGPESFAPFAAAARSMSWLPWGNHRSHQPARHLSSTGSRAGS